MSDDLGLLGRCAAIGKVRELIVRYARDNDPVLILGDSGTGKELVARAIHARSPRAGKAFVPCNLAAISATLIESELFGHVRGAFTGATDGRKGLFEQAEGGTLFLDEVGDLPLDLQPRLLRVLQERRVRPVGSQEPEKPVDFRTVAATSIHLTGRVESGEFRPELYYRLYVLPIELPPLKARGDDIVLLAEHFLKEKARENRVAECRLTDLACEALLVYHWPGNVRELQNVMKRAFRLACDPTSEPVGVLTIDREHLSFGPPESGPSAAVGTASYIALIEAAFEEMKVGRSPLEGLRNNDSRLGPLARKLLDDVLAEALRRYCTEFKTGQDMLEGNIRSGKVKQFDLLFYDGGPPSKDQRQIFRSAVMDMVRKVLDDLK